jgi:hypothetical protein
MSPAAGAHVVSLWQGIVISAAAGRCWTDRMYRDPPV